MVVLVMMAAVAEALSALLVQALLNVVLNGLLPFGWVYVLFVCRRESLCSLFSIVWINRKQNPFSRALCDF